MLAGYSTGHIRVFDVGTKALVVQINAHARWIHALEVHPVDPSYFASVSEDCNVGVWRLPDLESARVRQVAMHHAPDALLCGVAFCGSEKRDHVAVTAYDVQYVQAWALEM